ncbi:MAG: hypothetical protein K1X75_13840 [Leptospirales bacterium]|nr:hypothetical protein [Leptospirales bacterium]
MTLVALLILLAMIGIALSGRNALSQGQSPPDAILEGRFLAQIKLLGESLCAAGADWPERLLAELPARNAALLWRSAAMKSFRALHSRSAAPSGASTEAFDHCSLAERAASLAVEMEECKLLAAVVDWNLQATPTEPGEKVAARILIWLFPSGDPGAGAPWLALACLFDADQWLPGEECRNAFLIESRSGLENNLSFLRWRGAQQSPLQTQRSLMQNASPPRSPASPAAMHQALARAAHDLRTPLSALTLALEAEILSSGSVQKDTLLRLRRLLRPVEQFADDLQALDGREQRLLPAEIFAASGILSDAAEILTPLLHQRRLTVQCIQSLPAGDLFCYSHRSSALSIVLGICLSLARNALPGGVLNLSIESGRRFVLFRISDSRSGPLSAEAVIDLARWNIGPGGGGWGLSVFAARRQALRMGGRLFSSSDTAKGLQFLLVLPAATENLRESGHEYHSHAQ